MINQKQIYITIEWQEQGPMETSGHRLWREDRKVYTHLNYPDRLECHNPDCEDGGFEIGDRVAALLDSNKLSEQNSLICINAMPKEGRKRCMHTIIYSISCVLPFQRERPRSLTPNKSSG
jgi:hypothetical protein